MQVTTQLRGMFSYSLLPILLLSTILIIIFFFLTSKKKPYKEKPPIITLTPPQIDTIKTEYLAQIYTISSEYQAHKITNRKAYQKLSKLIRNFIFETTHIQVQNYTLQEIKEQQIPILYELVREYYDPEFSKNEQGNILESIEKTRQVIEKWK